MKVLMVVEAHTRQAGGGPMYWAQLSEQLIHRGHQVTILSGITPNAEFASPNTIGLLPVRANLRSRSLVTLLSRALFKRRLIPVVRAFVQDWQPDIIHTVPPIASEAAFRAGVQLGIPVIASILSHVERQWSLLESGALRARIFRYMESQAIRRPFTRIICLTRRSERVLITEGVAPEQVVYIPHAVDVKQFNPQIDPYFRKQLSLPKNAFVIGYAGALTREKGVVELLQAVTQISQRSDLFLLIAGGEKIQRTWRNGVQVLKSPRVRFLGPLDHAQMPGFMASLDLYVIPSYTETLPTTLLEALATGTPVMATAVGGVEEFLQDRFGIVLERPNVNLIAEALEEWMDRRSELRYMGEKGQQYVKDHHNWELVSRLTEGVYQTCLQMK